MENLLFLGVPILKHSRVIIEKLAEHGVQVIVIDLFSETVLFNHRGGRSPPRLLNRQSS